MEITVLSGKGGAGKTSLAVALAGIGPKKIICDCDVDAADMHLILAPKMIEKSFFVSGGIIEIDSQACTHCGLCQQLCRFDAINIDNNGVYEVNPLRCEACRLCERACPVAAISFQSEENNEWYVSDTRMGTMVHARMAPGEENSGRLVSLLRQKSRELMEQQGVGLILNDGPPGIGCPVISSLSGADRVLIVVEASHSGIHDAMRTIELAGQFENEIFVVINKADVNPHVTNDIRDLFNQKEIPVLAELPFDPLLTQSMINGLSICEEAPGSCFCKQIMYISDVLFA